MEIILLSAFSDWIESHIFQLISFLVILIGAIIWLIRLESSVKQVCEKMSELENCIEENTLDFNLHTKDKDAHVNHLYMQSLKERLIKLETTVENGQQKISDKIDRLSEKMYGRQ